MATSALQRDDLVLCAATVWTTPFLERLAPARDHGYRGVSVMPFELAPLFADGMTPEEIATRIADHGLAVAEVDGVTTWFDGHAPPAEWGSAGEAMRGNTAEALAPLAAQLGARSLSVFEYYGVDVDTDRAAEGFAHACDVGAEHGLLMTLEFLPWAGVPTLGAALDIVRTAGRPNGRVLVDSWHFFRSGATLDELAAAPGELIGYVQIDDAPATPDGDMQDETMHRRLVPGDGALDLVGFVRTLRAIGCDSPLGVEVYSDALAPLGADEIARRCADGTRAVLERAA
jgi:sugar phosphate isomerase/epimerase